MAACDASKMSIYICSILWDLNIPQEVATNTYEDNDACTAMANAQKSTPCTGHKDIKYVALCDWIAQDLIILEHISTKINLADLFTKPLDQALFHHHVDFILVHIPPCYSPVYSKLIAHTLTSIWILTNMCWVLSLLLYVQLLLKYICRFGKITLETHGFAFFGVGSTIQHTYWIVWGCYCISSRIVRSIPSLCMTSGNSKIKAINNLLKDFKVDMLCRCKTQVDWRMVPQD